MPLKKFHQRNIRNIFTIELKETMNNSYFQLMVIYYYQLLVSGDISIAMAVTCYVMAMAIAIRSYLTGATIAIVIAILVWRYYTIVITIYLAIYYHT